MGTRGTGGAYPGQGDIALYAGEKNAYTFSHTLGGSGRFLIRQRVSAMLNEMLSEYERGHLGMKSAYVIHDFYDQFEIFEGVSAYLRTFHYTDDDVNAIMFVFEELARNAYVHGNRLDERKSIYLRFNIADGEFWGEIEDEGAGFDYSAIANPADPLWLSKAIEENEAERYMRGRGIWLCKRYTNALQYNEKGNAVAFIRKRTQQ